ncbi:MAG: TlpA disulfide reductase family protein [Alphaproteobacteria bacterium]|nr:TlpA disulfide reductase family protein [Alphaproteobacteria bacterium]
MLASAIFFYETQRPSRARNLAQAKVLTYPDRDLIFTALETPRPLPTIRFVNRAGRAVAMADFRGRLVVLNIWATWCGPCRKEMPTLDVLQSMFGSRDFEVVALSIDRKGVPAIKAFYRELNLKALHIYVDKSGRVLRDLGVDGIPTTLLVDSKTREIGRVVGPAKWDSPEAVALVRRYLVPPSTKKER